MIGRHGHRRDGRSLVALVIGACLLLVTAAAPVTAGSPAGDPTLTFSKVAGGYDLPILVTSDGSPKRRLFVVEQTGRIRIVVLRDGRWRKRGTFLDLRAKVLAPPRGGGEQGLLGLAFAPDHATTGRFYVSYTRNGSGGRAGDTVVAEYRRSRALVADPASARTVLVVDQPYANHNGGGLAFGPDGLLYIALGDGGSGGDPQDRAQDGGSLLGKLLRIDPHDPDGGGPRRYGIPAGNPYLGEPERDEIWLSGVRNPWRWSFDRLTGDLVIGDVGQRTREELDLLPATGGVDAGKGANLGWNVCEGDLTYPDGDPCPAETNGFVEPLVTYGHDGSGPLDGGCSITGGHAIRDAGAPDWQGDIVFADFCTGRVAIVRPDGTRRLIQETGRSVSSFGEDAAGRLYLVDLSGVVLRIRFPAVP